MIRRGHSCFVFCCEPGMMKAAMTYGATYGEALNMDNLIYLDSCGAKSEIRIPYIPGYNDGQIDKIGKFLSELSHVIRVRVLPYHNYAASKYAALNIDNTLPPLMPTEKEIKDAETIIFSYGLMR